MDNSKVFNIKAIYPQQGRVVSSTEKREIVFPIGEAFRFSLESIRKRLTRALITALSIMLGIAFMVNLTTTGAIVGSQPEVGGEPIQAYQYWMVVIALLVCSVGIVNSMLMAVTERYKEIGTMKCLGATDGSILEIFLLESLLLGLFGGLVGSAIGWLVAIIMNGLQLGWPAIFLVSVSTYLFWIGIAIATALVISMFAGFLPAWRAARLNPADALRYEV